MQSVHILSHTYSMLHGINLLWPSDTRWRHRSWSTLAQAHYLNQCSLFISWVLWNSAGSNFTATAQATIPCNEFENYAFKIIATSLSHQWVHTTADLLMTDDALIDQNTDFPCICNLLLVHYVKYLFCVTPFFCQLPYPKMSYPFQTWL